MVRRFLMLSFVLFASHLVAPLPLHADDQTADTARVVVTVLDPTNATVPGATVTLLGLEDATRTVALSPGVTTATGAVTLERLAPGRYMIRATLSGFEPGQLNNVTLRRGDNRASIVLTLKTVTESVTVGGGQEATSSRNGSSFGLNLSREAIDTLSDDPAELQKQLLEQAGPDAVIRVDSFEGGQLPPKSQIKSIHVTRDQFAAEAEYPGSTFVDIITQPGSGPLSGQANLSYRPTAMAGDSRPFVTARQPELNRAFNGSLGGTLVKNRTDFSLSVRQQRQYVTPILNQSNAPARVLDLRQLTDRWEAYGLVNHAITRDQTLRFGYAMAAQQQDNLGIGAYDSPERAFSTHWNGFQFRVQQAGPLGRRTFQNTRFQFTNIDRTQTSALEQPTIVIQDRRTFGGAQVGGRANERTFFLSSDVDHIRGIHSWRAGLQVNGGWYDSDLTQGYLGTYTFADDDAYLAGRPLLYTRSIGDARVKYFNAQTAVYLQDDIRISKALTLSPGVRYMVQTHVRDLTGFAPRFGTTWSPFKSGRTAFRLSAGLFYWPMEMGNVYEQTLRFDGRHQQQVIVLNPSYPDPGPLSGLPPNKYVLGDYSLQRNLRYSAGIDQTFSPRVKMNVLYAYWHQYDFWSGRNLNAPVNGVRPDPAFANVIEAVTDGEIRRHDVTVNLNVAMVAPSGGAQKRFAWKRVALAATYARIRSWQHGDGAFSVPPGGDISTEWAPAPADQPYRLTGSLTSTQLRNLNVNLSWTGSAGSRYSLTTGRDDNQDGILNDRPAGVPLRSLRMADQATLNLRAAYTLTTAPQGSTRRYRVALNFSASNLTNRANFGGYSGKLTSDDFMQPTLVVNPRRVDVGMTVGF